MKIPLLLNPGGITLQVISSLIVVSIHLSIWTSQAIDVVIKENHIQLTNLSNTPRYKLELAFSVSELIDSVWIDNREESVFYKNDRIWLKSPKLLMGDTIIVHCKFRTNAKKRILYRSRVGTIDIRKFNPIRKWMNDFPIVSMVLLVIGAYGVGYLNVLWFYIFNKKKSYRSTYYLTNKGFVKELKKIADDTPYGKFD